MKNLIWIDLETTGLDLKEDKIIEIAILVTDTNLKILDEEGYVGFVKISQKDIELMNKKVFKMHSRNGVIENCVKSEFTLEEIDRESVKYLRQFVKENESPLCGNNIFFDRAFIDFNMSLLSNFLHYRNIDVTTVKQLSQIWKNDIYDKDDSTHEALDDIRASIEEMRYYKKTIF